MTEEMSENNHKSELLILLEKKSVLNQELTSEEYQRAKSLIEDAKLTDEDCNGCSFALSLEGGITIYDKIPKAIRGVGLCKKCALYSLEYVPYYKIREAQKQ